MRKRDKRLFINLTSKVNNFKVDDVLYTRGKLDLPGDTSQVLGRLIYLQSNIAGHHALNILQEDSKTSVTLHFLKEIIQRIL